MTDGKMTTRPRLVEGRDDIGEDFLLAGARLISELPTRSRRSW